jgi:multiple sugar transport system permease protein
MNRRLVPYYFLLPTILAILMGYFYPMLHAVGQSFMANQFARTGGRFVGFSNYVDVLAAPRFWSSLRVAVVYTLGATAGAVLFGFYTALMLNQPFRGRGVVRSLFIVSWAIPYVTAALIWRWMFDYQFGVINFTLTTTSLFSESIDWLNNPRLALSSITVVSVWKLYPLATVMYLAGFQTISPDLYEAGKVDGANAFKRMIYITVPGVRSVTTVLVLLIGIWIFGRAIVLTFLMTGGGPVGATENLALYMYNVAFQFFRMNQAAAIGTLVLLVSAVFAILYLRAMEARK